MVNTIQAKELNAVKKLAERLFSVPVINVSPITKGEVNKVFVIETPKMSLIVRINENKSYIREYEKEKLCMEKVSKLGVPLPRVLKIGSRIIPYVYMAYECIQGIPADEYKGDKLRVWYQIGEYAALINSIKTYGYGGRFQFQPHQDKDGNSHKNWIEYIDRGINMVLKSTLLVKNDVIRREEVSKIKSELEEIKVWQFKPRLGHGNLALKNTIVNKNGRVVAVLDWGDAVSHRAPHFELATTLFWINLAEQKAFLNGYGLSIERYEAIRKDVEKLQLLEHLGSAIWYIQRKDYKGLEYAKRKLRTIMPA
ncbi:aminoglycoside phosphotransferase family protein [Patescibacteria group bacterium AH-259-L07]|nr:aminoglycoside phosphotransferase family protein [Patescibacteria group bacterium AH-259-L07]